MKLRDWAKRSAGALAFCASTVLAQQDFSNVQITVHEVTDDIYYLEGSGGNVGILVGNEGILMVDDQFSELSGKLSAAIETISDAPIRFLVNTHIHGDHNGGNENFAAFGVTILAHDNVRARMVAGGRPQAGLPLVTYGDRVSFHFSGETVNVVKVTASHTDGDSIVHFTESDVIHAGDVFRTTGYPGVDVSNGGSVSGTLAALGAIIGMAGPDTQIIPGHGVVSKREDVIEFRDMVGELKRRFENLIDQGMTLEQVIAADPTSDLDARWGSFERFMPGFYEALANEM